MFAKLMTTVLPMGTESDTAWRRWDEEGRLDRFQVVGDRDGVIGNDYIQVHAADCGAFVFLATDKNSGARTCGCMYAKWDIWETRLLCSKNHKNKRVCSISFTNNTIIPKHPYMLKTVIEIHTRRGCISMTKYAYIYILTWKMMLSRYIGRLWLYLVQLLEKCFCY